MRLAFVSFSRCKQTYINTDTCMCNQFVKKIIMGTSKVRIKPGTASDRARKKRAPMNYYGILSSYTRIASIWQNGGGFISAVSFVSTDSLLLRFKTNSKRLFRNLLLGLVSLGFLKNYSK